MDTEKKVNDKILKLIVTIRDKYPELQHFAYERPVLIPRPKYPDTNIRNITEYYNALDMLVKSYVYNPGTFSASASSEGLDMKFVVSRKLSYSSLTAS